MLWLRGCEVRYSCVGDGSGNHDWRGGWGSRNARIGGEPVAVGADFYELRAADSSAPRTIGLVT